jgi:hypothetical protein
VQQAVWMGEEERWHFQVDRGPMTPIGQRLGDALMGLICFLSLQACSTRPGARPADAPS